MKRFLPLVVSLALLLAFSAAAYVRSAPSGQIEVAQAAQVADVSQPEAARPALPANAEAGDATQAAAVPKTGCGRAEPCPGRDCRDCPSNYLLK